MSRFAYALRLIAALAVFALIAIAAALSGCAELVPNSVRPELEHLSHVSQHVGADRTNYGADLLEVLAHWGHSSGPFLEVGEGYSLNRGWPNGDGYGEIYGPREQFIARAGYSFQVRP